jgi:hypothetical protein
LEQAIIEVSSASATLANRKVSGTIQQHERKDLTVSSQEEIPISAEVKVQSQRLLFLGHVQECIPESGASWSIHIRLRQTLLVV